MEVLTWKGNRGEALGGSSLVVNSAEAGGEMTDKPTDEQDQGPNQPVPPDRCPLADWDERERSRLGGGPRRVALGL